MFCHSILHFEDCKFELDRINYKSLYNDANQRHQGIGIGILGDRVISSIFVNSLAYDDKTHSIDKNKEAIPVYPFPSFVKQKDLYIFDFSQLASTNLYEQALINQFIPRICSILVISVPYHEKMDAYYNDFEPILAILKDDTNMSLLVLHYNVPPDQCDWEYEKTTKRFVSSLPHHLSNQLHEHTNFFEVIDIPSLVIHRSEITSPVPPSPHETTDKKGYRNLSSHLSPDASEETMVCLSPYMTQCVDCLTQLLKKMRSLLNAKQFISQLSIICLLLNEGVPASSSEVQKRLLSLCHIPSSSIQDSFLTIWKALCPNPSISLSHPRFGDDYYIRFQDRILLCEKLCLLKIATQLSSFYLDAMTPQSSFSFFRNLHKTIHSSIQSILPCTVKKTMNMNDNQYGITKVHNREYFRKENQENVQIHCIIPSAYHEQHTSVYTVEYKSKVRMKETPFQWEGDYQKPSIRHLDRDEMKETLFHFAHCKKAEHIILLTHIQKAHTTSRQIIHLCKETSLPTITKTCHICPYCVYCWKELQLPFVEQHPFAVNAEEASDFSQNDGSWIPEDVYLVECKICSEVRKMRPYRATLYPFCIDGVPSRYISTFHSSHICSLCSHCVLSSNQSEEYSHENRQSTTYSNPNNKIYRERMIDLVDYMNHALKKIRK